MRLRPQPIRYPAFGDIAESNMPLPRYAISVCGSGVKPELIYLRVRRYTSIAITSKTLGSIAITGSPLHVLILLSSVITRVRGTYWAAPNHNCNFYAGSNGCPGKGSPVSCVISKAKALLQGVAAAEGLP